MILCHDEFTRQTWKHCRWWFLSRHLLSFWWCFLSQQGLCERTNQGFSWGGSLVDAFWVGNDLVFGDDFRVKWDFVRWWIEASAKEAVSLIVSKLAETQLSLAISKSTRTLCPYESTCQPWKNYRWWFLNRQLLSFRWWFPSQQRLCAGTNPVFSLECSLVDGFWVSTDSVFACDFEVNRDFVRWRIHATAIEALSLMVFELAAI